MSLFRVVSFDYVGDVCVVVMFGLLFFKQKTAYEMRISDWSSDVCSSDLRTTRRVSMTVEGRTYYDQARGILAELDAVEASVGGAEAEPRGPLRVTLAHGFGMQQIVPLLPEFLARFPKVDVQLTRSEEHTSELQSLMRI